MNSDRMFLAVAGYVFAMLVVFPVSSCGAFLMLVGLLLFAHFVTQDDRSR